MTTTQETIRKEICFRVPQNPRHLIPSFEFDSKQFSESRQANLLSNATVKKLRLSRALAMSLGPANLKHCGAATNDRVQDMLHHAIPHAAVAAAAALPPPHQTSKAFWKITAASVSTKWPSSSEVLSISPIFGLVSPRQANSASWKLPAALLHRNVLRRYFQKLAQACVLEKRLYCNAACQWKTPSRCKQWSNLALPPHVCP